MNPKEIIERLNELVEKQKGVADALKSLSNATDDVDVVALITSLSMNGYDLAIDIQDSIDTYKEILEEEMEELDDIDEDDMELKIDDEE